MDAELHLVETLDDANQMARWLGERRRILAVDTETTGLDWWKDRLRLVQLGDERHGWAIPWEGWGGLAVEMLSKYDGDMCGHNLPFDVKMLEKQGRIKLNWGRLHDTRVQAHLIDPNRSTALKVVAGTEVDPMAGVGEVLLKEAFHKHGWDWATVPIDFEPYWAYGCLDTVITALLHEKQAPLIQADEGLRTIYQLERDVAPVLVGMEYHGFRIDPQHITSLKRQAEAYLVEIREWMFTEYGLENPGSARQLAEALEREGIRVPKTAKGNPQTDEKSLKLLRHPLASAVLDMRGKAKVVSSYLSNFEDLSVDEYLHCSINPLGAKTGRMSISRPSLQNIPHSRALRNCFRASEEHKLVTCDYDQIEMRLLAHYSQDRNLLEGFAGEVDFFTALARQIYSDPTFKKEDPRRGIVKNAAYGKAYGAGVTKFSESAGVPVSEGRAFLARFDATFPGVLAFQTQVDRIGRSRFAQEGLAYVRSFYGRMGQVDHADYSYKLVNYLLQGTAADILKRSLVDLDRAGLGEYLVLPVHDEVILDVPDEYVPDVAELVPSIMRDDSFSVPLSAGCEVISTWGERYE